MSNDFELGETGPYEPTRGDIVEIPTDSYSYGHANPYRDAGIDTMRGRVIDPDFDRDGDVVVDLIDSPDPNRTVGASYFDPEYITVVERNND